MVYIVVLNWKGAADTIACIESLASLRGVKYKIVICDNASPDLSYDVIREGILSSGFYKGHSLIELSREVAESYCLSKNAIKEDSIFLIQTGKNLGYSGGNNVGIRFALNQDDMQYVWLLNNDTEVDPDSLYHLISRCESDKRIGICGSKLIYNHNRSRLQGLGGIYNPWLGTTYHYEAYASSDTIYDDMIVSAAIDYVIGASMMLTRELITTVGLLCEDYFLYFEELDLSLRSKGLFKIAVATKSIVFHKEGGSIGGQKKSDLADYYAIKNRLLLSSKFFKKYFPFVWLSLVFVIVNRFRRGEYSKALQVIKIMLHW